MPPAYLEVQDDPMELGEEGEGGEAEAESCPKRTLKWRMIPWNWEKEEKQKKM